MKRVFTSKEGQWGVSRCQGQVNLQLFLCVAKIHIFVIKHRILIKKAFYLILDSKMESAILVPLFYP
jgi:hypothetical protein